MESIREVDFSGLKVPFVAVYGHPDDFPDKYVARIYELDRATDTGRNNSRYQRAYGHDIHSKRDGGRAVSGGRLDVGGQQHEKHKGI